MIDRLGTIKYIYCMTLNFPIFNISSKFRYNGSKIILYSIGSPISQKKKNRRKIHSKTCLESLSVNNYCKQQFVIGRNIKCLVLAALCT